MKKRIFLLLAAVIMLLGAFAINAAATDELADVYVATTGIDTNAGTEEAPVLSLNKALELVQNGGTIHIVDSYIAPSGFAWDTHNKDVTITGGKLDLSQGYTEATEGSVTIQCYYQGDAVTYDNLELILVDGAYYFANGYRLQVNENVTVTCNDIQLYGGGHRTVVAGTNVKLLGGNYLCANAYGSIYGGGYKANVNGDVNLYVGNINSQYTTSHSGKTRLYGGGFNCNVSGDINLTVAGANVDRIKGAGDQGTVSGDVNVLMSGGSAYSLYGGGGSSCTNSGDINLTVTGGTIARDVTDYPSHPYFGNRDKNCYTEDIYVGYRYFCTFAGDKVLYPFGFGMSYTTFGYTNCALTKNGDQVTVSLTVTNTGACSGKEVVQVYLQSPQGKLGKPERVLAAFGKTEELQPGEAQNLTMTFLLSDCASFDDLNETGNEHCFVLEQGEYGVCISTDAMHDVYRGTFALSEDIVVRRCNKAMQPVEDFEKIKPILRNGKYEVSFQKVTGQPNDLRSKIDAGVPAELPYTGDRGIKLKDVRDGKATMEEFIAQFSDEDLAVIAFGEGMNSPKVTGGTGCAFGGLSESLLKKGVPVACGTDGPSGLRMDCGAKGTSMPNGTMLACTWNESLLEELFTCEGKEMNENNIDVLLGPGMNIHRHPLCGRNFEYLSEDPYVSGRLAYAMCKGMANAGATGTIKHLCANNQETNRHNLNSVVSQRALREIYLKPFEIALKMGDACKAVMTSYNPVNGTWTAGHYDLTTTILREEWGYQGFVMSDWWCRTKLEEFDRYHGKINQGERDYIPCVEAQNDIYMCCKNSADFKNLNVYGGLVSGVLARGFAQRNAMNVCRFLMHSTAMDRFLAMSDAGIKAMLGKIEKGELLFESTELSAEQEVLFTCGQEGSYVFSADIISTGSQLSQNTAIFYADGEYLTSFTVAGSNGQVVENAKIVRLTAGEKCLTVKYPRDALSVASVRIYTEKD